MTIPPQTDFDLGNVVLQWRRQLTGPNGKQATQRILSRPRAGVHHHPKAGETSPTLGNTRTGGSWG